MHEGEEKMFSSIPTQRQELYICLFLEQRIDGVKKNI